jgi:hypothetical protein
VKKIALYENLPIEQKDPMLSMIENACTNPDFDVNKLQVLREMYKDEQSRLAQIDFNNDFASMQPKLPRVITTHYNQQTGSQYAKIEDVNQLVLPILSSHGFGISFKILEQNKEGVNIKAILKHRNGHEEDTQLFLPLDSAGIKGTVNKTNIHATASSITYAKRYAMCMLLDISTGTDNDAQQFIASCTAKRIKDILKNDNLDVKEFLNKMNVDCVENILSKDFEKANLELGRKLKEQKALFKNQTTE